MKNEERLMLLREAMDLVAEAQQLVDEALEGTARKIHYQAYGKYGFNRLLGNGNPYDSGLPQLIKISEKNY